MIGGNLSFGIGDEELTNQHPAWEILWEMLKEILWEMLQEILREMLWEIFKEILWEMLQEMLPKTLWDILWEENRISRELKNNQFA